MKFRVWDAYSNEWCNDFIVMQQDGNLLYRDKGNIYSMEYISSDCYPIISYYTGLKDKNNKEICENDIVEYNGVCTECNLYVIKRDYYGGFYMQNIKDHSLREFFNDYVKPSSCKIIGNIFVNKNLLKEK